MNLDDEICLCFHVTRRKILNFLRIQRPLRPGQLSECHGAGTGCGWCRPYLERLFAESEAGRSDAAAIPTPEEYAQQRARYIANNYRRDEDVADDGSGE